MNCTITLQPIPAQSNQEENGIKKQIANEKKSSEKDQERLLGFRGSIAPARAHIPTPGQQRNGKSGSRFAQAHTDSVQGKAQVIQQTAGAQEGMVTEICIDSSGMAGC